MDVDEDERGPEMVVQGVDGVDQMFARFVHEPDQRVLAGYQTLGEVRVAEAFCNSGQKSLHIGDGRQMRLHARSPALVLSAEIDVVVENLRLLFWCQLPYVDDGTAVGELREVSLPETTLRGFVDVFAGGQQKAVAVGDRGAQL